MNDFIPQRNDFVPQKHLTEQREFVKESWLQYVALCVIMSSFAILINNSSSLMTQSQNVKNKNVRGEPKVATYMIALSILILSFVTPPYIIQRWNTRSRYMSILSIGITLGLIVAFVWLLLRIWFCF